MARSGGPFFCGKPRAIKRTNRKYGTMFRWEVDNTVFIEDQRTLEAAMSTNPQTQKALQALVRQCILEARRAVIMNIKFNNGDPKESRRAVRSTVYRKLLGGNLNILNSKKAHGINPYQTPRRSQGNKRGGNRMLRSGRTQQILDYAPQDRGFILRFVDSGTKQRFVGFRNERKANRNRYIETKQRWDAGGTRTGNRGAIAARGFFQRYGENAMNYAAERLAAMIEKELGNTLDKN